MTQDYHHLATTNAPRTCGGCGAPATVYDHERGFRCSNCGDYPADRRTGTQTPNNSTTEDY